MVTVYDPLKIERIQESPYGSTLFPDFMYYSIRPVRAKPRGICFYVSDTARSIESVHVLSRNGRQTVYIKLYGDPTLTHLRNCLSVLMMLWKHVSRETDIVTREC